MSQDKDQYISHKDKMKSMSSAQRARLQANPLYVFEQDDEAREMRVETVTIFPRSHADASTGGHISFVMPNKGYLSGDSRLVIPATCKEEGYQYPVNAGVFSLIESATISTASSGVIAQVDQAGELYSIMNQLKSAESKDRIDSVIHGVNFSFETASGSKLNSQKDDAESLPGQYRLVCDKYEEKFPNQKVLGLDNEPPFMVDGSPEFKLKTFYKDKDDEAGTPEYSIALDDLFPGLFKDNFRLPLGLIREEVVIDINLSRDGELGSNDRAIFCPNASNKTLSSVNQVGIYGAGITTQTAESYGHVAYHGDVSKGNVQLSTLNPTDGTGLRVIFDVGEFTNDDNETYYSPTNFEVIDPGIGYTGTETFIISNYLGLESDQAHPPCFFNVGHRFSSPMDDINLFPDKNGKGYVVGDKYQVSMPYQPNNSFYIKCTSVVNSIDAVSNISNIVGAWTEQDEVIIVQNGAYNGIGNPVIDGGTLTGVTIINSGKGFTAGAVVLQNGDASKTADATITITNGLGSCTLYDANENQRLALPTSYHDWNEASPQSYPVVGGASVVFVNKFFNVTCENQDGARNIEKGDILMVSGDEGTAYVVLEVDANLPTLLGQLGTTLPDVGNELSTNGYTADVATVGDTTDNIEVAGLGLDPIFAYNNNDRKIEVQTAHCHIATDLIFYQDGTEERDAHQMMDKNGKGLVKIFTQFRNIKTSLESDDDISDYGIKKDYEHSRLIGLSNEVLRNIIFSMYPTGTHKNAYQLAHPYYKLNKFNQLMNKYCSRASLAKDGLKFNVNVNSVPYYSNKVESDFRMWAEVNKCFKTPLYVNKGLYVAYNQARQLDNPEVISDAEPSQQPAFCNLKDRTIPTSKYEINERKASIVNQTYLGVKQSCMRGMGHLNGVSFMKTNQNAPGNGILVGATPVDLQIEYSETFDPMFSGPSMLSVYGEVERLFILKNGEIAVQSVVE